MNKAEHEGILAIFLVEAEEIVERLSEQLTELQYGYDGQRILDDIHRGFYTLHGGATVLDLAEIAECGLLAERLMERLRTGRLSLSPAVISLILNAVQLLETMLARRINHQPPESISSELKERLLRAADGSHKVANAFVSAKPAADPIGLYFDGRLKTRKTPAIKHANASVAVESAAPEQITDDEFENLLDSLYGKGRGPTPRKVRDQGGAAINGGGLPTMARPLQQVAATAVASVAKDDGNISHLVQELCWVRNRLMRFQGPEKNTELDKALSYLDLVAQDLDTWLLERAKDS